VWWGAAIKVWLTKHIYRLATEIHAGQLKLAWTGQAIEPAMSCEPGCIWIAAGHITEMWSSPAS